MASLVFYYQTDSMIMRSACDAYKSVPETKPNTTKTKSQTTASENKKNVFQNEAKRIGREARLDGCQPTMCMEFLCELSRATDTHYLGI